MDGSESEGVKRETLRRIASRRLAHIRNIHRWMDNVEYKIGTAGKMTILEFVEAPPKGLQMSFTVTPYGFMTFTCTGAGRVLTRPWKPT